MKPLSPETKIVYACAECGSMRIQWQSWVDANRDEPMDESGDDKWCPRCEEHDRCILVIERHTDGDLVWWGAAAWNLAASDPRHHYPSLKAALRAHREQGPNRRTNLEEP